MADATTAPPLATDALFRLDGRVAIVTGGAGLLAGEHATALSDMGAHVVLADRKGEECVQRAAQVSERSGRRALGLACDVLSKESWESLLRATLDSFGRVDILVNNAAFTSESRSPNYDAEFPNFPVEDWNSILGVNLTGSFLGCQVVGRELVARGSGSIINIASLYAVVSPHHPMYPGTGIVQPVAYSVSKAGVLGLTRYLGTLWAPRGVRVNALTPGGVYSGQQELFVQRFSGLNPMGRMARKEEMRGAIVYLASDASSHCAGMNLVVDGGWTAW